MESKAVLCNAPQPFCAHEHPPCKRSEARVLYKASENLAYLYDHPMSAQGGGQNPQVPRKASSLSHFLRTSQFLCVLRSERLFLLSTQRSVADAFKTDLKLEWMTRAALKHRFRRCIF
eukprot:3948019-Amphidinium_carterae.2